MTYAEENSYNAGSMTAYFRLYSKTDGSILIINYGRLGDFHILDTMHYKAANNNFIIVYYAHSYKPGSFPIVLTDYIPYNGTKYNLNSYIDKQYAFQIKLSKAYEDFYEDSNVIEVQPKINWLAICAYIN